MTFIVDDNDHILWSFYHQNIWDVVESKIFKKLWEEPIRCVKCLNGELLKKGNKDKFL